MPLTQSFAKAYSDLEAAKGQKDLVDLDLSSIGSFEKKKSEAVASIASKSEPFFSSLPTESIVLYLQDTALASGLSLGGLNISAESAVKVLPPEPAVNKLTYPISVIAERYLDLENPSPTSSVTPTAAPSPAAGEDIGTPGSVADLSIQMSFTGTYAQFKDFLTRIAALDRTIIVNNLSIGNASAADATATGMTVTVQFDFYGIEKIVEQPDDDFIWTRPVVTGKPDPFQ